MPHIAPRLATTQVESIWAEAAEKRNWDLSGLHEPDGGFTKNPRTGTEIKSGLSVGGYGTKVEIPVAQLKQHHIDRYMRENHDSLTTGSDRAIGAWHDPDTHHVALDVAQVFPKGAPRRGYGCRAPEQAEEYRRSRRNPSRRLG